MKVAAFFDIDFTLLKMNTIDQFADYLVRAGELEKDWTDYVFREISIEKSRGANRNTTNGMFFRLFEGWHYDKYHRAGADWWKQADKHFIEPVYLGFERLQQQGAYLIALSGSFSTCVEAISRSIGMTHWWASEPETDNGLLTGKASLSMIGEQKSRMVREFLDSHKKDIRSTIGYGDHESDFPMLSSVDDAYLVVNAVSQSAFLEREALDRAWNIVRV
jgi:HAD superfamily hydrolase (TIGR01490 family)